MEQDDDMLDRWLNWHDRHPRFIRAFVIVLFTITFILAFEQLR